MNHRRPRASRRRPQPAEPKGRCRLDLRRYVPYRISIVSALLRRAMANIYRPDPGLTEPEWKVMTALAHYGPVASGDLGLYLTLDRVAVSRALNRLIECGFAARTVHAGDQRMFLVDLTPEAARLYDRMAEQALAIEARILDLLTQEEVDNLLHTLDKIEACFRGHADPRNLSAAEGALEHYLRDQQPADVLPSKSRKHLKLL